MTTSGTRERILDEAMALFARQGFKATTIIDIEQAAGLTPGAGGVFHHFATKRQVLAEAVERRFDQLEALNLVRSVIPPLGDRRAELGQFARFLLEQLAEERDLMSVVLRESGTADSLMGEAINRLFEERTVSFARWIGGLSARQRPSKDLLALARVAIGGLAYGPTIDALTGQETSEMTGRHIDRWVDATLTLLGERTPSP